MDNKLVDKKHRPFFLRRAIVWLALPLAYLALGLSDNLLLMVAVYFASVTCMDLLSHYVFHLKSSDYADADQLMADDQATLADLDDYSAKRRTIRFVSFCTALILASISYLFASEHTLATFCITYLVTTILGLGYFKPHIRKKYPVVIKKDDQYYSPSEPLRPGHITPETAALAIEGEWAWGPIQH